MKNMKELKKPSNKLVKRVVIIGIVLLILIACGAVAIEMMEVRQEQKVNDATISIGVSQAEASGIKLITKEKAIQVALQAAGVKESQVRRLEVKLEMDQHEYPVNQYVYEVDFMHNGLEYTVDIDGIDKTVLHTDIESWND